MSLLSLQILKVTFLRGQHLKTVCLFGLFLGFRDYFIRAPFRNDVILFINTSFQAFQSFFFSLMKLVQQIHPNTKLPSSWPFLGYITFMKLDHICSTESFLSQDEIISLSFINETTIVFHL